MREICLFVLSILISIQNGQVLSDCPSLTAEKPAVPILSFPFAFPLASVQSRFIP